MKIAMPEPTPLESTNKEADVIEGNHSDAVVIIDGG